MHIVFLIFLSATIYSQNLKFKHITTRNGLPQNNVLAIIQDSDGFMWFGTRDGLCRYDGYNTKIYRNIKNDSNSLNSNYIRAIFEDHKGILWIGTMGGGLNRYNKELDNFVHYLPDSANNNSISHINIAKIIEDSHGNLWIGTMGGGISIFDRKRENFTHLNNNSNGQSKLSHNSIRALCEDNDKNIWIGFWGPGGLNKYNSKTKKTTHIFNEPTNPNSISSNNVRAIFEDSEDNLWIGTDDAGLNIFDKKTGNFKRFQHNPKSNNTISHNAISTIIEDDNNNIWIGTENGGISIYSKETGIFTNYLNNYNDAQSINSSSIYSMFKNVEGDIWIGTYTGGVNVYFKSYNTFRHYKHNSSNPKSLSHNNVLCIYNDRYNNFWIGTDGGGLNLFDAINNTFKAYTHDKFKKGSIGSNYVVSVYHDKQGNLWTANWTGGLNRFDYSTQSFTSYQNDVNNPKSISSNRVWVVYEDYLGILWVGTFYGALDVLDRKTGEFMHYYHDPANPNSVSRSDITTLIEDKNNNLWVGTDGDGLNLFVREKNEFIRFKHDPNNPSSICDNNIMVAYKDNKQNLWFGTNKGLSLLNAEELTFTNYSVNDGLPSNLILGVLEDNNGFLWISSNKGITRFNPITRECYTFGEVHGLQDLEFKRSSCFKDKNGYMYFGGLNGFNVFHPDSVKIKMHHTRIALVDLQIFNTSVNIQMPNAPITKAINVTEKINLSYKHSVFSIEYAALNYSFSEEIEYAYILEGFDNDWHYVGKKRDATYTNIPPGKYTFKVKCKIEGLWIDEYNEVEIVIAPPFWQTIWFRLLAFIFVLAVLASFYFARIASIKQANIKLSRLVNERTKEISTKNKLLITQAEELIHSNQIIKERQQSIEEQSEELMAQRDELSKANATKDKLFSILAHDLRSPFNTLLGFSDLLLKNIRNYTIEKIEEQVRIIYESAQSTFHLLENLLQWSRSQRGMLEYDPVETDIVSILGSELRILNKQSLRKEVVIDAKVEGEPHSIIADEQMIGSVLRNLISNAIKFSYKTGTVTIVVSFNLNEVVVSIMDNGTGMDKITCENLFNIYEHKSNKGTSGEKGTGLGLLLCSDFITLHKGKLWVKSEQGRGSTFYFSIPYINQE